MYWFTSLGGAPEPPEGQSPRALIEPLLPQFDDGFRALVAATPDGDLRLDDLRVRPLLERWGTGSVTLLGDAAHPILPHAGQGAAQALEDAIAFGLALQALGPVPAALRRYEALRLQRAHRVVRLAQRNARLGSLKSPLSCWLRDAMIRRVPERILLGSLIDMGKAPHDTDV